MLCWFCEPWVVAKICNLVCGHLRSVDIFYTIFYWFYSLHSYCLCFFFDKTTMFSFHYFLYSREATPDWQLNIRIMVTWIVRIIHRCWAFNVLWIWNWIITVPCETCNRYWYEFLTDVFKFYSLFTLLLVWWITFIVHISRHKLCYY